MRVVLAPGSYAYGPGGVPLVAGSYSAAWVADCLVRGWRAKRPGDRLDLAGQPDMAVESGAYEPVVAAQGQHYVDLARLCSLPADTHQAGLQAASGSTFALGVAFKQALEQLPAGSTVVVGACRSAIHDGGAGFLQALGGAQAAWQLTAPYQLIVALSDAMALSGLSGAGANLSALTDLDAVQVQEIDRRAANASAQCLRQLEAARPAHRRQLLTQGPRSSAWGSGALGGVSLILAALGANLVLAGNYYAQATDLVQLASQAQLLVTGYGQAFDVVAGSPLDTVGQAGLEHGVPVVALLGQGTLGRSELAEAGITRLHTLDEVLDTPWWQASSEQVAQGLEQIGQRLAQAWSR